MILPPIVDNCMRSIIHYLLTASGLRVRLARSRGRQQDARTFCGGVRGFDGGRVRNESGAHSMILVVDRFGRTTHYRYFADERAYLWILLAPDVVLQRRAIVR